MYIRRQFIVNPIAIVACALALGVAAKSLSHHQAPQAKSQPLPGGLPSRMRDLKDLAEPISDRKRFSKFDASEVLLTWLKEERRSPSETTTGWAGGPISSGYIQAQMIRGLWELSDPNILKWLESRVEDKEIGNALRIALGMMGDEEQLDELEHILMHHPEPYYRAAAAVALGDLGMTEGIQALEYAATNDTFYIVATPTHSESLGERMPDGPLISYVVRNTSKTSLRRLKEPKYQPNYVLARKRFEEKTRSLPQFAVRNKGALQRILKRLK